MARALFPCSRSEGRCDPTAKDAKHGARLKFPPERLAPRSRASSAVW